MDFGDILDKWEKQASGAVVGKKEEENPAPSSHPGRRRYILLRKKPDAVIDLHGMTGDEAWTSLDVFFENSRRMEFEKILVIHGKGNHAQNEGVLGEITRRFIERCSFAGESGYSGARDGGTGATWVFLKSQV